MAKRKSKNQLRREKAKSRKVDGPSVESKVLNAPDSSIIDLHTTRKSSTIDIEPLEQDELFEQFQQVINKFENTNESRGDLKLQDKSQITNTKTSDRKSDDSGSESESESESEPESESESESTLSKRQLRKLHKVPLVELKMISKNPQVVEWYDADAKDPFTLIAIKSSHNIVPVPSSWSGKREYLSSKRGREKIPYELPQYILSTGIQDMRKTDDEKTLKQSQRDRVQPKMGRLDIDYQKLHDAFFKFQTKPKLYGYGDMYYEGREVTDKFAIELVNIKPGILSKQLRNALGMGDDIHKSPPWIHTMEKLGKPPAYSKLNIPGLDLPYDNIPYGSEKSKASADGNITFWGALHESEDDSSEDESEDEDKDENDENDRNEENVEGDDNEDDEGPAKVAISEYGGISSSIDSKPKPSKDEHKKLYTVLDQKEDTASLSNKTYRYGEEKETNVEIKKTFTEADAKKFKF